MMDILDTAIAAEDGVGRLAEALGVRQSVVSNWRKRGLPRPWRLVLGYRYGGAIAASKVIGQAEPPVCVAMDSKATEVAHG
ncbi:hypothetical protein [Acidovorax sp. Leaf160]|uniref:hypothetical protein n=1 Tax=Acidovorax sp. Leaf160 TaxID=1736280 RepID=UPI0012E3C1A3|nr:hypothetical protein [Acidovorax sp. Leaf160]